MAVLVVALQLTRLVIYLELLGRELRHKETMAV
jgi:hypothetical protein